MNSPVHARIETLKLRVPAGDTRSAKALAMQVAAKLAQQTATLQASPLIRARVKQSPGMTLADSIVAGITGNRGNE